MAVITKDLDYRTKRITIKINGADKTNLIDVSSLNVKDNLYSKANNCFFTYKKFGDRTYVPSGGDEIGIWDRDVKIFGGKIINVSVRVEGKTIVYEVEGKDWIDQLDGLLVAETYESKTVNEIITDLQSKYATSFDISNVNCSTNIEAIYFNMKPMSKCLDELAEIAGYHWFVDANKNIYFFAEGTILAPFNITDDNGKVIGENLEITEDYGQIKNRINIEGGKVSRIQVYDSTSIATYGEHEVLIRDNTLTSTAEATQKANAVLASYKDPIKNGRFTTYFAGLISGQKININSSLRGINQDFIIQSVNFRMLTPISFVYEVEVMTQLEKGLIDLLQHEIIAPPPVTTTSFGDQNFICDVKFSIVDYHTISWSAGTIKMSNGDSYSIVSGSHTIGGSTEICYFDPDTSATTLQFSSTFADGVGEGKTALGYAVPNPNTALGAQFIPKGFMGGVRFWGGENIVARTIVADQIGLHALTADLVTTGEFITQSAQIKNGIIQDAHIANLSADKITTGTLDASVVNVTHLSADNITTGILTGRTVRTSSGTTRVEINGTDNALYVYNNGNRTLKLSEDQITFYYQGDERGSMVGITDNGVRIFGRNTDNSYFAAVNIQATGSALGNFSPCWGHTVDLGTSSYPFQKLYVDEIELNGESRTTWPSGGASNLSDLTIDVDKDWNAKSISNIKSITQAGSTGIIDFHIGKMRIPVGTDRYN